MAVERLTAWTSRRWSRRRSRDEVEKGVLRARWCMTGPAHLVVERLGGDAETVTVLHSLRTLTLSSFFVLERRRLSGVPAGTPAGCALPTREQIAGEEEKRATRNGRGLVPTLSNLPMLRRPGGGLMRGVPSEMDREFVHLGGCLGVAARSKRNGPRGSVPFRRCRGRALCDVADSGLWLTEMAMVSRCVRSPQAGVRRSERLCLFLFEMRRTVFAPVPTTTDNSGNRQPHILSSRPSPATVRQRWLPVRQFSQLNPPKPNT